MAKKSHKELREQRNATKDIMTLDKHKERSCETKVFYATEALAIRSIREQSHKDLYHYGCNFCGGFHVATVKF